MGLFSSIFGTKQKTKTTVPAWIKGPLSSYMGDVQGYLAQDPRSFVAPASDLQNLAFDQAKNLGSWQTPMGDALSAVKAAGAAPAASAGEAAQTTLSQTGPAAQATASTYNAPKLGAASQAGATTIAPVSTINGESLLDNFNAYLDPGIANLVDTSLATYDREAAQRRAAEDAKRAGNGAWGSGGQFYMSNFDQATALGGAQLEAQLRAQAWRDAIMASSSDADRRQGASGFNAGAANTRALNQGQLDSTRNMFNTDALNQFKLSQAGFDAQAGQFNANAQNQIGMFNAGQSNDMSMFNTGQANQVGMYNTGQTNDMAQYNAGLENASLDRALQAAGMQGDIANMYGSNQRADTALVGTLGEMQRSIDQAYASALPTQLALAGQMYGGLNLPGYTGQSQTSTPSPFSVGLQLAQFIPGFSDSRLKRNIRKIGEYADGLGKYAWDYVVGGPSEGVLAEEVERLRPWAMGPTVNGYKTVNYSMLEA